MSNKIPKTPFATRLSGSAKETQLRIRSIFQWKKKRPPVWLFAFIVVVIFGCIGLVSCREKEDVLCMGLNARVVEIDPEQMILYIQDIDEDAAIFGQRCALDCKQAAEEKKLIFVDYETSELTDIPFAEFQMGDELVISMYASQRDGAKDAVARAEQVQLGTQRPLYVTLTQVATWYGEFLENIRGDFENEPYDGIRKFDSDDRTLIYEDGPENVVESLVSFQYYCQTLLKFDKLNDHIGSDGLKRSVENERKQAAEGVYFEKVAIHEFDTLTKEDFEPGSKYVSDSKQSFEFVDQVNYFKDIYGLTEYAVVYVDLSWQWSEKALSMGPQLDNGRYERLYLVGKTGEDDAWKIYECFWGEHILGRTFSEQDAINALLMSELFTASNVSDIAPTPTGQLLVAPAAEGQSFTAAYFTERDNYELVIAVWDAESNAIVGTPFRAANSGGTPQVISYEKEGLQRLLYTANGMSQGYTYGQAGDIVLRDGAIVWEWPVQGDIRDMTRDSSGKPYQDYLDYWTDHLALMSDGGLEIYIENEAFGPYEGSPQQWMPYGNYDGVLRLHPVNPETTTATESSLVSPVDVRMIGGVSYETYTDNRGVVRLKDSVGNLEMLELKDIPLMQATLVDGGYPENSRGETYGDLDLADYVGEQPDLISCWGYDSTYERVQGYVFWQDYYSDKAEVTLYDAEHRPIGTSFSSGALEEESAQIQRMELSGETTVTKQDEDTLVIATTRDGEQVELQPSNHGVILVPVTYEELTQEQLDLLQKYPNGYPQNSRGEYYGEEGLEHYFNVSLDLIAATGTEGQHGYIWWEDAEIRIFSIEDLDQHIWNEEGYLIPLYDSERSQIGWVQRYSSFTYEDTQLSLNEKTVEALKTGLVPI